MNLFLAVVKPSVHDKITFCNAVSLAERWVSCMNQWRRRTVMHYCLNRGNTLQWRHNDHDSVSNHQPHGCLFNRLFRRRSKETSKLIVTGLCVGNSPGPVNSPLEGPVTRKMFPFDDVIMYVWIHCGLRMLGYTYVIHMLYAVADLRQHWTLFSAIHPMITSQVIRWILFIKSAYNKYSHISHTTLFWLKICS